MKEKKNRVIIFLVLIIVAIIALVLAIFFGKKEEIISNLSANKYVIGSLTGGSQEEIDDTIRRDLENNKYTVSKAAIYMNPYGTSPLSGLIVFRTEEETSATVTIKGKNNNDITLNYDSVVDHYLPIFGLYPNYKNTVEVKLSDGKTATYEIEIGEIENIPSAKVNTNEMEADDNGLYFITSPITMNSFAVDKYGELRWLSPMFMYHNIEPLENGHMLIGTSTMNSDGLSTRLLETDYLGRIYNEYNIEEGYLNDIFVKNSGNILVASKKTDRKTYSDYIIEIDKTTGKIVKTTDVYEALENIDKSFTDNLSSEWFFNSGIEYYSDTDTLLLTYWGGEFVISMNYKDGSVNWIFSNPENFTDKFNNVLLKAPEGFNYPKSMHSASLQGNTLKVFDNGYDVNKELEDENYPKSKHLLGSYSSAQTFTIDNSNITLTSTIDEDKKLFSYALADYKTANENDEIILFGRELKDLDYNSDININEYDKLASRLIEYKNGKKALDIELDVATYSVAKIDLSKNYTYGFEKLKTHTTLLPTEKEKITNEILNQIKSSEEIVDYEFGYSNGFIECNVLYMKSDEAKMVLIDDNNNGTVYTLKVKDEYAIKKIYTDLPKGKYYIYILENGMMKKTNSQLEIEDK